jgi:predicted RND superfamily exporter protein
LLFLLLAFLSYHARDFQLDASADSLLLEDDADLEVFRDVRERYPEKDLLLVTYAPNDDLFSDVSLKRIGDLRDRLREMAEIDSVVTILDVPLLKNRDMPLIEAANSYRTLEQPQVDKPRARQEILQSSIYSDLILSDDARTTALLVNLRDDRDLASLLETRNTLRAKKRASGLNDTEQARLEAVSTEYDTAHTAHAEQRHRIVGAIRAVMEPYRKHAVLHLGGVPMIADDMITFVRNDLIVFGAGVLVFLVLVLTIIFRQTRWIVLPLLSCFYAGVVMIGLLGLLGLKVTVISSNFLALMLIITISMNIHLIVRYKQLCSDFASLDQTELVATTTRKMVKPCLYTALTTIIGFGSLVVSQIKPVIDFGWMMSAGLTVTFLTSFLLFPSILVILPRSDTGTTNEREFRLPGLLATLTERHGGKVVAISLVLAAISVAGISQLKVELIDRKLGGTTPVELILHLNEDVEEDADALPEDEELSEEDAEFAELDRLYAEEIASSPEYWFTPYKVDSIKRAHDYLESLPEVGKVLSLASVVRVGEDLNDGEEFDSLELSLLYKRAPEELRASMIDPYVSIEHNEARLVMRVRDSQEDLRRNELLKKIESDLKDDLQFEDKQYTVTGMLVLYNNMLQSLVASQIYTLGVVMLGIALMFLALFRSALLSAIGIVPNLLGALVVLGMMGWLQIPLDMMTITIAAITIGIAVDNGIHYIYRFREEYAQNGDYVKSMHVCHANIGKAVLYTTTTVIAGFSILVLSNFIPTIYFGLLTALAMLIALLSALTLLPKLILAWRPFGQA